MLCQTQFPYVALFYIKTKGHNVSEWKDFLNIFSDNSNFLKMFSGTTLSLKVVSVFEFYGIY
jgi:hypothetical protein